MNNNCQVCSGSSVKKLLDFGPQPLCNRFSIAPHEDDYYHPLILGQCQDCSLIQLMDPIPASEIIPRVDWLRYAEPERHLDNLADIVSSLDSLPEKPVACGVTYKDDSLLKRLEERSFEKTWRIQPKQDLGIKEKGIAGETIIPKLNFNSVNNITNTYGYADVVIARHVLEHALDTQVFLSTIWNMLKPEGYIVFEVPDCTKQLENKDYTLPWEEHILYFVPETLKSTFDYTSYELTQYCHYPYQTEDVQVVIIRKAEAHVKENLQPPPEAFILPEAYANSFENHRKIIYSYLKEYVSKVGKIAFYGAGHFSVMLIKSLQIEEFIEFIIDDTELKQKLYLAGTSLQIKPSEHLEFEKISLCILCLNIEHQNKIMKKHNRFIAAGGIFASAFPMQENSLFEIANNNYRK